MRHIISLLMENEAGALSRVAGLFSARGYNIESLTVAATEDPTLSRMTIVTVSYTHLDVYKRQRHFSVIRQFQSSLATRSGKLK